MAINKTFIYSSILLASILGPQCKSSHKSTSRAALYKSLYIEEFKLTYFQQILLNSYNNSTAIQEIIQLDHSGFKEPLLAMEDYKLIDSLTKADNQKMKLDSANSIGRVAEGAEGKHPLAFILAKLNSKWLDSLANKRYKSFGLKEIHNY